MVIRATENEAKQRGKRKYIVHAHLNQEKIIADIFVQSTERFISLKVPNIHRTIPASVVTRHHTLINCVKNKNRLKIGRFNLDKQFRRTDCYFPTFR